MSIEMLQANTGPAPRGVECLIPVEDIIDETKRLLAEYQHAIYDIPEEERKLVEQLFPGTLDLSSEFLYEQIRQKN